MAHSNRDDKPSPLGDAPHATASPHAASPHAATPPLPGDADGPEAKAAFTVPDTATLGDDAPPISMDDYVVHIQLIPSDDGPPLLLETDRQVRSRYAFYRRKEMAKLEGVAELQALRQKTIDAERDAFIAAMKTVAEKYGKYALRYWFKFRTPTVYDVEEAEAQTLAPRPLPVVSSTPAGSGGQLLVRVEEPVDPEAKFPVRARSKFRRHLAARTFMDTNYPKFSSIERNGTERNGTERGGTEDSGSLTRHERLYDAFGCLPNALQEIVTVEVSQRIAFESDALAFLESWEPAY